MQLLEKVLADSEDDSLEIETLVELSQAPELRTVSELDLSEVILGREGAEVLFGSRFIDSIQYLALSDEDCQLEIVALLVQASMPRLRQLEMCGYMHAALGDEGVALLAESAFSNKLELLSLFNCGIGGKGAAALAAAKDMVNLRELRLGGGSYSRNEIQAEGADAIAKSESLSGLTLLDLNFNNIGEAGVEALGKSKTLTNLNNLYLEGNGFSHEGFKHLCVSDTLDRVEQLVLSHNDLASRAVEGLVTSAPKRLNTLWLYHNPIGDKGVRMLVDSPLANQLLSINLRQVGMSDEGAESVLASPNLDCVQSLYVGLNGLSQENHSALLSRFGSALLD